jgi:hypothetical protein
MSLSVGGTLTGTANNSLTDANAQRIIAHHRKRYGMNPAATAQQVWTRIDEEVLDILKTRTINGELADAVEALAPPAIIS